jgi:plasmid stabilization system protein ParE
LRISRRVVAAVDRLRTYPYLGRAASWDLRKQLREIPVARTPFVVVYAIDVANETMVILRVVPGAQRRGAD